MTFKQRSGRSTGANQRALWASMLQAEGGTNANSSQSVLQILQWDSPIFSDFFFTPSPPPTFPHVTNLVSGICSIFSFPNLVSLGEIPAICHLLQEASNFLPQSCLLPIPLPVALITAGAQVSNVADCVFSLRRPVVWLSCTIPKCRSIRTLCYVQKCHKMICPICWPNWFCPDTDHHLLIYTSMPLLILEDICSVAELLSLLLEMFLDLSN